MITGDITENSATNLYNNAKLSKQPKLPPLKGMVTHITRNSVMGKTQRIGKAPDDGSYKAVINSEIRPPPTGKGDKRQIVLNVKSKGNNAALQASQVTTRPRSKQQIRATTQATQHRSNKLAPLEVKF